MGGRTKVGEGDCSRSSPEIMTESVEHPSASCPGY